MKEKPRLEVQHLQRRFGRRPVVRDVSFQLFPGEVVGLLGPNGAGKTTAFYMTVGLIAPNNGKIFFEGKDITSWPVHKRAMAGLGYLAQEPSIFSDLTVEDNLRLVVDYLGLSKKEKEKKIAELLGELSLEGLAKSYAAELSGGERRRLEITRALAREPSCLLMDEPFANIDPLSVREVKSLVEHLSKKGISVLITDHNAREIFQLVERSYILVEGKVLVSGTKEELLGSREARTFYLGEDFTL